MKKVNKYFRKRSYWENLNLNLKLLKTVGKYIQVKILLANSEKNQMIFKIVLVFLNKLLEK